MKGLPGRGAPHIRLPMVPTPSHSSVSVARASSAPSAWAATGSLSWRAALAKPWARATAFMAPALVPLMPSKTRLPSSSSASSTPQVRAPCEPPPCRARLILQVGVGVMAVCPGPSAVHGLVAVHGDHAAHDAVEEPDDRKSTRLNSSHSQISYAVFCLKKKNKYPNAYPEQPEARPQMN